MAIKLAKQVVEGYKYTPKSEVGEAEPFSVWVKPISTRDLMVLEDGIVKRENETVFLSAGQFSFKVLQKALVSWENIFDAEGSLLKIEKNADGTISEKTIGALGAEYITEIANCVSAISRNPANIAVFFPEDEEATQPTKKVKAPTTVE